MPWTHLPFSSQTYMYMCMHVYMYICYIYVILPVKLKMPPRTYTNSTTHQQCNFSAMSSTGYTASPNTNMYIVHVQNIRNSSPGKAVGKRFCGSQQIQRPPEEKHYTLHLLPCLSCAKPSQKIWKPNHVFWPRYAFLTDVEVS